MNDSDLTTFLDQGYLVLDLDDVDEATHDRPFRDAQEACETRERLKDSRFGPALIADNLTARRPALRSILVAPSLHGALEDILGERYFRYPHSFVHRSGEADQGFHKDSHICKALLSGVDPAPSPIWRELVPMNRVRQSAALALLNVVTEAMGANVETARLGPIATELCRRAGAETDRYAAGCLLESRQRLARAGSKHALDHVLGLLHTARWTATPGTPGSLANKR